jgi:tRNA-binding EMAP/Myf-like protein
MPETFAAYTARLLSLAEGAEPLEVLASTPARLGDLIAGRAAADLQTSPEAGRWSVAQILAHLADAEIVFAYRLRMILARPGVAIQAYDQQAWSAAQRAESSDPFESLSLFAALRTADVRLLRALTAEERERFGVHAERGHESLGHLMRLYAGHDRNHLSQVERLLAVTEPSADARAFVPAPVKAEIDASVLDRLDVRAGTIRAAVPIERADRLARLTVAFADRERTIVAGIRTERRSLDALVGRQCLFVVNLAPKTIRGHRSEGMLFDIGFADGLRPAFATPEWPVPDGTRAG